MPIQYGEITIIHNEEDEGFINSIFRTWLNYEFKPNSNSQIVILFEDGEICDINDKLKDFEYKFLNSSTSRTPGYFEKKNKKIYFKKSPITNDKGEERLKFTDLFKSYSKYSQFNLRPSTYNCIYYHNINCNKPEVFGVVRLKSSENKPRFQFAYDNDEFSKEEVIYLINYIFKNKIET